MANSKQNKTSPGTFHLIHFQVFTYLFLRMKYTNQWDRKTHTTLKQAHHYATTLKSIVTFTTSSR